MTGDILYECTAEDGCYVTGCDDCGYEEIDEEDMYCYSDDLNCSDFNTQAEAQAFYEMVLDNEGYDYHGLDGDSNCVACQGMT